MTDKTITISETKDHIAISLLSEELFNLHSILHPDIFKPHNSAAIEKTLSDFFKDPNCKCYIARQDGIDVGFAIFLIREVDETEFLKRFKTIYIDQIAVLTKYRRTGAGQLLMKQAEILAKENSIKHITLEHWTRNDIAAAYFRKKGFTPYRERLMKTID